MKHAHNYETHIRWTGNLGEGTINYTGYSRDHLLETGQKVGVPLSSDPSFRGDAHRYNPEELLVASLSSCHMLWYLHLCAEAGIVVTAYEDKATGIMEEDEDGSGRFKEVTLHPMVIILQDDKAGTALKLHEAAHEKCYIANSCNFPVNHQPKIFVSF